MIWMIWDGRQINAQAFSGMELGFLGLISCDFSAEKHPESEDKDPNKT
jgi:hypothetical protein